MKARGQMIVTLGGRAHAGLCSPTSLGLHNCNFLRMCVSRMSEVSCFVLILKYQRHGQ